MSDGVRTGGWDGRSTWWTSYWQWFGHVRVTGVGVGGEVQGDMDG